MGINREKFLAKNGLPATTVLDFNTIAQMSGIPYDALTAVYNRGVASWLSNPKHKKEDKLFNSNARQREEFVAGYRQTLEEKGRERLYDFLVFARKSLKNDSDIYSAFAIPIPMKPRKAEKPESSPDHSSQEE
jgi:hypothetical protein